MAICNCPAMVDTLLVNQLLRHVRGSFTGATDTRPELFEYANGGTVFLDEVGEISLPIGFLQIVLRVRPAGLREKAAIHAERLAGDERSSIAEKEFNGRGYVLGGANSAQ